MFFLEWTPLPENPVNGANRNGIENANDALALQDSIILQKVFTHNFYHNLFIFWLVDYKNIYATIFEIMIFITVYNYHSFVLASKEVIAEYIKKVSSRFNQKYL